MNVTASIDPVRRADGIEDQRVAATEAARVDEEQQERSTRD
jgi:hypothetical protein